MGLKHSSRFEGQGGQTRYGATEEGHQHALYTKLKKLEDASLTLFGGVSPREERVKALKECATPTDVKSLLSLHRSMEYQVYERHFHDC